MGRRMGAEEAARYGLVNKVVAAAERDRGIVAILEAIRATRRGP